MFNNENPKNYRESLSESKLEITPEHSAATLRMVEQIDGRIADSENLLGGLGRVAREQIITDPRALEEIYAPKEIGRMNLKGEHDAPALELASNGLRIRHTIFRLFGGSKHILTGEDGLVDKRKLTEGTAGEKYDLMRWNGELEEVAENFNLDPAEINPQDFSKTYVEGKRGKSAEKIISREKTEQEINKAAGDILEKQLKNLETNTGVELVKQKQGLEEFKKEIEQHKDVLSSEDLTKTDNEYLVRKELIGEKQKDLNSNLENIRSPFLEQRENLTQAIEGLDSLLKDTDGQEKTYLGKISDLQNKITKISGSKQLKEVLGDEIKQWEQEKKQAEVNLKDFQETKKALSKRTIELKKSQIEVDATLTRINNIGKTKEELRAKKAEKLSEEKRQKEAPEAEKKNVDPAVVIAPVASVESGEDGSGEAIEVVGETKARPASSRPVEEKPKKPKIEADATAAPERQRGAKPEKAEEIKLKVEEWLVKLKIGGIDLETMDTIKRYFRLSGQKYDRTASMTLDQAKVAYRGYLVEHSELTSMNSIEQRVNEDFEKIIKNLS